MLLRSDPFRDFDRLASQLFADTRTPRAMPMDAFRSEDSLHIAFDLPGIDPDSIDLTVEKNALTVTATRSFNYSDAEEIVVNERPQGAYSRQVFLGEGLDIDNLEAAYRDGVLYVKVPVLESARPRRVPISIQSGDQQEITAGTS
ncbi:MAG: Hsp20/alpha crystallin family protein [Nitriliruptoraceae bacterium]